MDNLDYTIRGGDNSNKVLNEIEKQIKSIALNNFTKSPFYQRKGMKWTYNWFHFSSMYATRNPELRKVIFEQRPMPSYLEVEVSTYCNLRCNMCEQCYWNEKPKNMSYDNFVYILDQFPDLKWIGLTGIGESYLNPDFPEMLNECKRRGLFIENFDNFVLLNKERAEHLVKIKADKLYVSLDAATKETYEKIRVGAKWEHVINNIKTLDRLKKKYKCYEPELWFHFIIQKANKDEMEKYLELINELDIDCKQVQFTVLLHPYKEIKDLVCDITDDDKRRVIAKAQELGLNVTFNMNTSSCRAPMSECTLWTQPFIFVDGTVIPCCSMNEQNDRPWQIKTRLGNIFETPFRDIWYGEKYKNMCKSISENKKCAQCSRCFLYNDI